MRLANMTWPHAEEYFKNNDTILLSVGSIECHGKHLPLGTDTLIPEKLLDLIEPLTDVAIAPIIPFGACDSQADYPGTVSLGLDVLYDVFTKLTQGFKAHGIRRFAVLNGHGGNIPHDTSRIIHYNDVVGVHVEAVICFTNLHSVAEQQTIVSVELGKLALANFHPQRHPFPHDVVEIRPNEGKLVLPAHAGRALKGHEAEGFFSEIDLDTLRAKHPLGSPL